MKLDMKKTRTRLLTILSAFALSAIALTSSAGLRDELDGVFGGLGESFNATTPGIHKTQTRGVISGGSIKMRSKIVNANLLSFTPPSAKGGCGGIDLHGGSFSYINADELVTLLRSVASNAKGYAFQLALDAICKDCMKNIESLQKKVQAINEHLGNSCQLAQGIVNDSIKAFGAKSENEASILAAGKGLYDDFFEIKQASKSPEQEIVDTADSNEDGARDLIKEELAGNVVWNRLKSQNAMSWFRYGDRNMLETLMSITGTFIRDVPTKGLTGAGAGAGAATPSLKSTENERVLASKPKIIPALLSGGDVEIYKCDTEEFCLEPTDQTINLEGMVVKIENTLIGNGTTNIGVVRKYSTNTGVFSQSEQALLASLPSGYGSLIRNLSIVSPDVAIEFVRQTSTAMAVPMIQSMVDEMIGAVNLSLFHTASSHAPIVKRQIELARREAKAEFDIYLNFYGDTSEIMAKYNAIAVNARKAKYTASQLTRPARTRD